MNTAKITISPAFPSSDGSLFLSANLMKQLGIQSGQREVAFGMKKMTVDVRSLEYGGERDRVFVSKDVVKALHLPLNKPLSLFEQGSKLRFGYVFGLMADIQQKQGKYVGFTRPILKQTIQEAVKQGMYAYVFSPLDADFDSQEVTGFLLDDRGLWKQVRAPLPDVMYDRISSRSFAAAPHVADKIEQLYGLLGPRFFNKGYFHKWQLHQWLSGDKQTVGYVPDTVRFESTEQSVSFLKQHQDLYIKPGMGALGKGIIRAKRSADGRVHYQVQQEKGPVRNGIALSAMAFFHQNKQHFHRGHYILQQTLSLMKWRERPFDIRLLMQKDGEGQWKRTKLFCRMSHVGSITSNLSAGAEAMEVAEVLQDVFKEESRVRQAITELEAVAGQVAKVLEGQVSPSLGELGFDFAFDQKGKLWIIEVNAKPMKRQNVTDGKHGERNKLAYKRTIQYALYLCETNNDL